jgi:hypothetical protein
MATPDVMNMPEGISYRDHWARWRVRKRLANLYTHIPNEPGEIQDLLPQIPSGPVQPYDLPQLPEFQPRQTLPPEMKVCIVGAGAAGLFTAMIFDWLKEKSKCRVIPELNISYDIFEANPQERLGGRLYTYKFPSTPKYQSGDHDYYDVGAMRFPENPIMKRLVFNITTCLHLLTE